MNMEKHNNHGEIKNNMREINELIKKYDKEIDDLLTENNVLFLCPLQYESSLIPMQFPLKQRSYF